MGKRELTHEDTEDWTADERSAVRLAALVIEGDESLTLEEKFEFMWAVIMKSLNRGQS